MAMNYLQYINSVYQADQTYSNIRFLVSGVDLKVRRVIGQNIIESCRSRGLTLFIVDTTQSNTNFYTEFGDYRVVDVLNGEVSLCSDLLEVRTLKGISRLRGLLTDLGFDETRAMKVIAYLSFIKETERRLGNVGNLTVSTLEEYGGTMLVKLKLNRLVDDGILTRENYEYLMGRYSEVSNAAADFELFLVLFAPFLGSIYPSSDMAVVLPVGEFNSDKSIQAVMCKFMISYIKQNSDCSAVLILDDGKGERNFIIDILNNIPITTEVHMLSKDAFSFNEVDVSILMNSFPIRIYTRHEDTISCGKVSAQCGQVDVVKKASTVTIDKRFKSNSAWDMLMGTNRTETEIRNAPIKEDRFRKEMVNALLPGTGIIDYAGNKVLFSF